MFIINSLCRFLNRPHFNFNFLVIFDLNKIKNIHENDKPFIKSIIVFPPAELHELFKVKPIFTLWSRIKQSLTNLVQRSILLHLLSKSCQIWLINVPFSILIDRLKHSDQIVLSIFLIRLGCH